MHAKRKNYLTQSSSKKGNSIRGHSQLACAISKNLTFHMARHTFVTTITLSNGVPIETVSKMLGHTKISTTQIYAKVIERKVCEDMNNLRELLDSKRKQNDTNTNCDIC